MTPDAKAQLLAQFSAYLDEAADALPVDSDRVKPASNEQLDLFSLFVELSALRNEVKIESRQVKTALDEFRAVFALLQSSQERLEAEQERAESSQQALQDSALRPLLLELLELYDRLDAGVQSLAALPPPRLAWLKKPELARLHAVREAQHISLRRLQSILQRYQVRAFNTQGAPLDPQIARVVELTQRPELDNGVVVDELRKGFYWGDELLRPAEVTVNKREH